MLSVGVSLAGMIPAAALYELAFLAALAIVVVILLS
jgi:hypothetical protein